MDHRKDRLGLISFLVACCWAQLTFATHIVGGEINYRCLGSDQYEISLTIFRDCDTGVPWFDNPASIGVFDFNTNVFLFEKRINLNNAINDTLPISLPDSCLIVASNACIHTTTYVDTISLLQNSGGYIIAYQRCCRNQDILNITSPNTTGATYWTHITAGAMGGCNNSAIFREFPPVYLCANVPINYDYSAIDPDGDSLVYELCTPYDGGSQVNPIPQPPNAPPYGSINWQAPYSQNNMFGGPDPLSIDPQTGLLTGTPQNLGVFLVGVCIKEYRNGSLISTTRRDFQHIVGTCDPKTTAEFDTTLFNCNKDLNIQFVNTSTVLSGSYIWSFDTFGISTQVNPSFIFPDTGNYEITLIAGVGSPCLDTFVMNASLQIEAIELSLTANTQLCLGDSMLISATDAYAAYSDSVSYAWLPNQNILSGQGTDSVWVFVDQNTTFTVTGVNNFGCVSSASVPVGFIDNNAAFNFTIPPCNGSLEVFFNNISSNTPFNSNYMWQIDTLMSGTASNQTVNFPDTGTYTVTLISGLGTPCPDTSIQNIDLQLNAVILENIPSDTLCLGDSLWLQGNNLLNSYSNTNYQWFGDSLLNPNGNLDSILFVGDTSISFVLLAINEYDCTDSIAFSIDVLSNQSGFYMDSFPCNISLSSPVINQSSSNFLEMDYQWLLNGQSYSNLDEPIYSFPDTGNYTIGLISSLNGLCPDTAFQELVLNLTGIDLSVDDLTVLCNDDSTMAFAINSLSDYSDSIFYFWYPDTLILSQQGLDSAVLLVDSNVLNYYVVALNEYGCYDTAFFVIEIQNNSPILNIQASPDSIFVGQTSQLLATDSIDYTYNWWPDSSLSANQIFNPEASPDVETTYYLSVQNLLGCVTMDSVVIYILDPICGLPTVYIPNAFSPDGDGYNDIHYINGNNINQIYFQVFDRWGNKVFESRDQNVGWDGKLNGSELAPDVYGYFLECTCDDGSTLKTKGNISLIR